MESEGKEKRVIGWRRSLEILTQETESFLGPKVVEGDSKRAT